MKRKVYPLVRMRPETIKKFREKKERIEKTIGKKVPLTLIFESAASNPLFIKEIDLTRLKKWRKYFR